VLNHSYTSKDTRVSTAIQVGYDSDVDLALRLMQDAALADPRVLHAPTRPAAFVNRFGDHGIELELVVWINDPENGQQNLRSKLNREIWKAFKAQGIEVPVPQREVRLIGGEAQPAAVSSPPRGAQADSDR
jgi:small-conductance mechanosensitive channel